MLNAVIKFSLRHRPLIVVGALIVLLYGSYLATTMPIDVFPSLDRPRVTIMTEAHGLAPEEVELQVTYPLESAMLGATGVQDVRSQSGFGLSIVYVEFNWGTDLRVARQTVQERLATVAADLPEEARPQMTPVSSIMGQFLVAGLRRQNGPKGGELIPVTGTEYYAERVPKPGSKPELLAWKVKDRHNLATWEPVPVSGAAWGKVATDGDQSVRATIAGQEQQLVFPSEVKRAVSLRTLADWVVRPRLLKVPGMAQVTVMGGGRKQYHVLVDPTALLEYGVTLHDVDTALKANNVNFTGGFAEVGGMEKPIRVIGRIGPSYEQVIADLKQIPVKVPDVAHVTEPNAKREQPPRPILLGNVARVVEGMQVRRGDAGVNGFRGVALTLTRQPNSDTRDVTTRTQAALVELTPSLPADVIIEPDLYELRAFIDRGVFNVGEALVLGAVLVLIVLFLFLLNFRTTSISLVAIPLSLAVTVLVFKLIGTVFGVELSINVMTLGGIAVALGELVDDSIVDVENIYRRLRENRVSASPRPPLRVVYEASVEVRTSIVFGTAVVILVFLPLFALQGIEGRLFTPLGIAYIVSILASLLISLTITPVLSYYLLGRGATPKASLNPSEHHRATHDDGLLLRVLKWAAGHLVRFSMRRAGILLVLTWLIVAYSAWRLTTIGADFLPPFDEGAAQLTLILPAGTSIEESARTGALVDTALAALRVTPENPNALIVSFVRKTGRGELDEHAMPPNESDIIVQLNPNSGLLRAEVLEQLRHEVMDAAPGAEVEIEQPLAHLISHMISGNTAQIAIKLFGDDLDTLENLANRVKSSVGQIEGVSSLAVEPIRKVDEIHIRLRPESLAFHGLDRAYVGRFVQTALNGEVVSQVIEGQRRFDLVVRLDEPYRADVANLAELHLELPGEHRHVHLGHLADITPMTGGDTGANQVKRENSRRRIVVRCNAVGRDLASVVADIEAAVKRDVPMPVGYFVEYGGQFESQQAATRMIMILSAVSVIGMFLVLSMLFPSPRIVLQILNAIPTAFIGGVLALVITGQTLTVAALVGFISLGGIAVRNGILLVTHYIHLMKHEGEGFSQQMILRGSLERLAPVLMTALTAGIALVPLVAAGHQPGREILYPVATVILGGLITSTFCEFLIHPGLFWRFSGKAGMRMARANSESDELDDTHDRHTPTH